MCLTPFTVSSIVLGNVGNEFVLTNFYNKSERNGFETSLLIDLLMVSFLAELLNVKCHF